jgi:hypothetical protein
MKFWHRASAALLLSAPAALSLAANLPLKLAGEGPYYRLTLPLSVYGMAEHGDLANLRIRNAASEAVPYAWLRDDANPPRLAAATVPIFPLPGDEAATTTTPASGDASLSFTIRPDGSLSLNARTAPKRRAADKATQWIIDASQIKGSLLQARFELAADARGVFPLELEASNDLKHWNPVGSASDQLMRLSHGGRSLERLALDLGGLRARFLRLRWLDPSQRAALVSVDIDSLDEAEPVAPLQWSAAIAPSSCTVGACDYLLPRGLPVQSLRIELATTNTLAQIEVIGLRDIAPVEIVPRHHHNPLYVLRHGRRHEVPATTREVAVQQPLVYRLTQGKLEVRSSDIALDGSVFDRLRLKTRGPISALGATAPTIRVGAVPPSLVFLAQGAAPYSMSWGAATDEAGMALTLDTLLPERKTDEPIAAGDAEVVVPAPARPASAAPSAVTVAASAPAEPRSHRRWALSAVLAIAVGVLTAMVLPLLAASKKKAAEDDPPA